MDDGEVLLMSGRVYERKFDWGEARRLRASGIPYAKIAEQLCVSYAAVRYACDARAYAVSRLNQWSAQRRGTCVDCGAQISSNASVPAARCISCASVAAGTSAREAELYCANCNEWKPDNDFPFSRAATSVRRGRHQSCRTCQTVLRRQRRDKNKVPCANGCGALVGDGPTGMCHACACATKALRRASDAVAA